MYLIRQLTIEDGPDFAYQTIIKAKPYKKYIDEDHTLIKYFCPVCAEKGYNSQSLTIGIDNCPVCGVNINWSQK